MLQKLQVWGWEGTRVAGLASPAPLAQLRFSTATGVTGPNWDMQGLMSRRDENILDFGDPKLVFLHCFHPVLQVETCPSPRSLPSLEFHPVWSLSPGLYLIGREEVCPLSILMVSLSFLPG